MVSYFDDTVNKRQSLKKIKDPDDEDSFVLIPVTDQIAFRDPKTDAQQIVIRFDLTETGGRIFHVHRVHPKSGTPDDYEEDADQFIEVERPDSVGVVDPKTNKQGYAFRLNNKDTADSWPALPGILNTYNLQHVRHVVRYTADNTIDGEPWVDVELIDLFPVRDPKSDNQEHIYRITYAEKGPPIDDLEDPYLPTFAIADRDLTTVTREPGSIIDPPYRTSPLENIVNFSFGGVVEFETDTADPHGSATGQLLAGMARMKQEETTIEDFKKATWSIFFNVPPDPADPVANPGTTFQGQSSLMHWGGRIGGDGGTIAGQGFPGSSRLWIGNDIIGENFNPGINLLLRSGVFDVEIDPPESWYDDHGYVSGAEPEDGQATLRFRARMELGGINSAWRTSLTLANKFADAWHHLLISIDASDIDFSDADTEQIWNWGWEATGVPDLIDPPDDNLTLEGNSELAGHGYSPSVGMTLDTTQIDIRPNPFSGGALPPPPQEKARVRVLYTASAGDAIVYGGSGVTEGMTLAQTWGTFGDPFIGGSFDIPCHMMLDGKLYKGDLTNDPPIPDPENTWPVVGMSVSALDITNDDRDGFAIDGLEPLAIPRQASNIQHAFDNTPPDDNRLRLAKVQVWFGTFVNLTVDSAKNVAKFLTITTDQDTGLRYGKPAAFTADELALMNANNLPPDSPLRLSPAALAFGEPTLYQDGGPAKFLINRGTDDDFIEVNDIEKFSPGPKKIPIPT